MKVTRPRRMRERPERREREWSEARGAETEARTELEGSSRPDENCFVSLYRALAQVWGLRCEVWLLITNLIFGL